VTGAGIQLIMSRTVTIEVFCETTEGEKDLFGLLSEHRPDLPEPFDTPLQEWVKQNFADMDPGESNKSAGVMEYEPDGEIIQFREK